MRGFLLKRGGGGLKSPSFYMSKNMISKNIIRDIVFSVIGETAIFLVDIRVDSSNKISVEVDKPEGITIEECVNISRAIENGLDRELEDFELEVSSPGLTEPFRVLEQYLKNCGRQVDVVKKDGQKINGLLLEASEEGIVLETKVKIRETGQKRPKTVTQTVSLKFSDIKATKVTITF